MSDHSPLQNNTKSIPQNTSLHQNSTGESIAVSENEMQQQKYFVSAGEVTPQTVQLLQRIHGNHYTQRYVQEHQPAPVRQPAAASPEGIFPVLKTGTRQYTQTTTAEPAAHHDSEKPVQPARQSQQDSMMFRAVAQHVVGQWVNSLHRSSTAAVYNAGLSQVSPPPGVERYPVGEESEEAAGASVPVRRGTAAGETLPETAGDTAIDSQVLNRVPGATTIHPTTIAQTAIDRNSASLGPTTYGFVFKHTLNTNTGGTITPDVMIAEHVTVGRDDFNTGWGGVPLGTLTWGPGGTAPLSGNDMYDNITTPGVNVTNFMPSPPKPGLPAILETPQTLHYRIGTGSWIQFASVPMILTLRARAAGGYEVETAINGVGRPQTYTGPT